MSGMPPMPHAHTPTISARFRVLAPIALILTPVAAITRARATTEQSPAYIVEVSDVTAKVGNDTVMLATLKIRDGYRILTAYNNHVSQLSSWDDGVAFDHKVVPATVKEGALAFAVGLRAIKPGKHPINGVFRVGYIHSTDEMAMVSLPLIATVTGTE
jgi:hypothetical protein